MDKKRSFMVRNIRVTGSILAIFLLIAPFFLHAESATFDTETYVLAPNTEFTVVVNAEDLVEAGAVDFLLEYDPTVITYVGTVAGPLMEPISLFGILDATSSIAVDTEQLLVSVPSDMSISGSGELATVTFRTNATGGTTTVDMVSMTMFGFEFPFAETSASLPLPVQVFIPSGEFVQTVYDSIENNTEIEITVQANDLFETGAVDFLLEYDPTVITYVGTVAGPLMEPISLFGILDATSSIAVDTEQLLVSVPSDMSISGSGELATVTFRTNATGGTTTVDMVSMTMFGFEFPFAETALPFAESAEIGVVIPDTTPPSRSALSPSGELAQGTSDTSLSVVTDENATCQYATVADTLFGDGTVFTTTGALTHTTPISGLVNGGSYTYFIRCEDSEGNANSDDASITFSIQAVVSSGGGGGGGGGSSRDTSAPRRTSVSINNDEKTTNTRTVELTLSARDESEPIEMQISNTDSFVGAEWVAFTDTYDWVLSSGEGEKTVFARFKDRRDNISDAVSDSIMLEGGSQATGSSVHSPSGIAYASSEGGITPSATQGYHFLRNMGLGTQGADVVELQQRLRQEGFFTYPTNTGYFGPVTAEAVRQYQKSHGIDTTGFVGPQTLQQLNSTLGTASGEESDLDLEMLIRLFLALGIIAPEKADIAFAALAIL